MKETKLSLSTPINITTSTITTQVLSPWLLRLEVVRVLVFSVSSISDPSLAFHAITSPRERSPEQQSAPLHCHATTAPRHQTLPIHGITNIISVSLTAPIIHLFITTPFGGKELGVSYYQLVGESNSPSSVFSSSIPSCQEATHAWLDTTGQPALLYLLKMTWLPLSLLVALFRSRAGERRGRAIT